MKNFSGKFIPSILEMIPLNKKGNKTVIVYNELEFDSPEVDESIFTLRNLKSRF